MKKTIKQVTDSGNVQVTVADERWYSDIAQVDGMPEVKWYPSVTWILSYYPKGTQFYKWLAQQGWDESQAIKDSAAIRGTKIHSAISLLVAGQEVRMDSVITTEEGDAELTVDEYEALMSFVQWHQINQPKYLLWDATVINRDIGYAGSLDIIAEIKGERWLIDIKTGQNLQPSYGLQLSAYKHAAILGGISQDHLQVDRLAILQVGYKRNKDGFKFTEYQDKFDLFKSVYSLWKDDMEEASPTVREYPPVLTLDTPSDKVQTKRTKTGGTK